MNKKLEFFGNVELGIIRPDFKTSIRLQNKLTNGGLEMFAQILGLVPPSPTLPVIELGTSAIPPDITDASLYLPYFRKAIDPVSYEDATLKFTGIISNFQAVQTPPDEVREMGLFWGDGADPGIIGSGRLIARVLVTPSFTKTTTEEIEIYWSYRLKETYENLPER